MNKYKRSTAASSMIGLVFSGLLLLSSHSAKALTIILDLTSLNTSETIFTSGYTTDAFDPTAFGFTASDFNTISNSILNGVIQDFRGYPTVGTDGASSIPVGKELNIDFEIGSIFNAPTNSDSEYFFMKVGERDPVTTSGSLGHACLGCVRTNTGSGALVSNAALVGSILTDNISTVSHTAGDLTEVTNLLAGTISHEIGHTLSLKHAGVVTNPGESTFSIMGTGASPYLMPDGDRILDRAFSYDQITTLATAVGLRDVSAVPLPPSVYLFGFSLAILGLMKPRQKRAA